MPLPRKPCGPLRVLFMDEERTLCAVAELLLMSLGCAPVCVYDGTQVIEVYRCALHAGQTFAVVILDLTVTKGMGACDTIAQLRILDPHVKAIVSSGYCGNPIMTDYKHHGFAAALAKPYSRVELAVAIQRALASTSPQSPFSRRIEH